jgi:hypothetical protein
MFADFGIPQQIQTDGDGTFVAEVIQDMIRAHGVEHKTIPAYVPRVNGKVERHVGTIQTLLHKLVSANGQPWDVVTPAAQLMLNNKHRYLTNAAPFALFFNRALNVFESYTSAPIKELSVDDMALWRERELKLHGQVFPTVRFRADAISSDKNHDFNASRLKAHDKLPCGTIVMLRDQLRGSKNSPPWLGPYTIVRVSPIGLYTLRDAAGGIFHRDVPRDHLKILTDANLNPKGAYYVDRIVDHRTHNGHHEYLVEWTGSSERSWVKQADVDDLDLIRSYLATQRSLPKKTRPPTAATSQLSEDVPSASTSPSASSALTSSQSAMPQEDAAPLIIHPPLDLSKQYVWTSAGGIFPIHNIEQQGDMVTFDLHKPQSQRAREHAQHGRQSCNINDIKLASLYMSDLRTTRSMVKQQQP